MSHRSAVILIIVVLADAVAWLVTVHATLSCHAERGQPSVMTLGDLLGWIISVGLFVVAVLMVVARLRSAQRGRRLDSWMRDVGR